MTSDPISKVSLSMTVEELRMFYNVGLVSLQAALAVPDLGDAIFDDAQLLSVTRGINRVIARQGVTMESLARVGSLVAQEPAVFPPRGQMLEHGMRVSWASAVACRSAAVAISHLGMRYGVLPAPLDSTLVAVAVDAGAVDTEVDRIVAAMMKASSAAPPRARAVILTPLGQITNDEQEPLLEDARAIDDALRETFNIHTTTPGEYIRPSDVVDDSGISLYRMARMKVDSSDLVVALFGSHESDGMSKCIAWAEAVGIDVLVLRGSVEGMSKVVSHADVRTEHELYGPTPTQNAQTARDFVRRHEATIFAHMEDRRHRAARVLPQLPIFREILRNAEPILVARERLNSAASTPEAVATLTAFEMQQICESLPPDLADRFAAIALGREVGNSTDGLDVVVSLQNFIAGNPGVTAAEALSLQQLHAQNRKSLTATAADRLPSGEDWARLLVQVRSR